MAKQIKMRHPDHENRTDDGIFYADSEVEAMELSTRGYKRVDDEPGADSGRKAPAQNGRKAAASGGSGPEDS